MSRTPLSKLQSLSLSALLLASTADARLLRSQNSSVRDVTFTLTRLPENPRQYSLVLSDPDERSVSGVFSVDQLEVIRAIMTEAEKFALSEEGAGTKEPIVTRFADKQETAFLVDVEKLGKQSRLFVTLSTDIGRMTADAGQVNRSIRRETGFFFELLDRLETLSPKRTAK